MRTRRRASALRLTQKHTHVGFFAFSIFCATRHARVSFLSFLCEYKLLSDARLLMHAPLLRGPEKARKWKAPRQCTPLMVWRVDSERQVTRERGNGLEHCSSWSVLARNDCTAVTYRLHGLVQVP